MNANAPMSSGLQQPPPMSQPYIGGDWSGQNMQPPAPTSATQPGSPQQFQAPTGTRYPYHEEPRENIVVNIVPPTTAPSPTPSAAPTIPPGAVVSKTTVVMILSFLFIYVIIYAIIRLILGENMSVAYKGIFIDIFFALLILFFIFNANYNTKNNDPMGNTLLWFRNYMDSVGNVFLTLLCIIFFYLLVYVLQVPMDPEDRPLSLVIVSGFIWAFFAIELFNILCLLLFGFSIVDIFMNPIIQGWYNLPNSSNNAVQLDASGHVIDPSGIFGWLANPYQDLQGQDFSDAAYYKMTTTPPPISVSLPQSYYGCHTTPPSKNDGNEVFNISNNLYTYDDANAICQAFGARLATYDEIEDAYNDGGEWCNYGWSANQMALFPTQKETWNNLQQTASHKNDCGRPGVNGGYMENPNLKFGVNCYGPKPTYSPKDISGVKMDLANAVSDQEMERIAYWKAHMKDLKLNSFNFSNWSEYMQPTTTPPPTTSPPSTTPTAPPTDPPTSPAPTTTIPIKTTTPSPTTTVPMRTTPFYNADVQSG